MQTLHWVRMIITGEVSVASAVSVATQPAGQRLTFGPLALPARPQIEQGGALVQQRVGVLHANPVDVVHAKVQLTGQL